MSDIHLLVGGMDGGERRQLAARATSQGTLAVTVDAITAAGERFGVPVLPALVDSPSVRAAATWSCLEPGRTMVDMLREDPRVLPGWRAMAQLVLEHLFPPAAYMRQAYAVSHPIVLPQAYTYRILTGVARSFRRHEKAVRGVGRLARRPRGVNRSQASSTRGLQTSQAWLASQPPGRVIGENRTRSMMNCVSTRSRSRRQLKP